MVDVFGLGAVLVDHQVVLPNHPEVDTKTEILQYRLQVGGPVPTALVLLQRLGQTCAFAGAWGPDRFGDLITEDLTGEGLDVSHSIHRGGSGFAHVWIDERTGARTVAYSRGDSGQIEPEDLNEQMFAGVRVLHLDGWSAPAAVRAARIVKRLGGRVFLDAGGPKPGMRDLWPLVDVAVCPRRSIGRHLSVKDEASAVGAVLEMGVEALVLTSGVEGAVAFTGTGEYRQPAFPVKAVDTTGAGDVFCGGLIHAYLEGMDWSGAIRFASAAAALKCAALGNREALPELRHILRLVNDGARTL